MKKADPIQLSSEERSTLNAWAGGRKLPLRIIQRAQIICMAADGVLSQDIAQTLQISRPTVQLWRQRFLSLRLAGLEKDA
ncbi:MAG: helix-turn-helix domain-containing protein, partial [Planctomycetes bacterium]|nr:helix-turn-helix domain-containing protein [Planctomycetota bacterium]